MLLLFLRARVILEGVANVICFGYVLECFEYEFVQNNGRTCLVLHVARVLIFFAIRLEVLLKIFVLWGLYLQLDELVSSMQTEGRRGTLHDSHILLLLLSTHLGLFWNFLESLLLFVLFEAS
jgi:hypothetical protein